MSNRLSNMVACFGFKNGVMCRGRIFIVFLLLISPLNSSLLLYIFLMFSLFQTLFPTDIFNEECNLLPILAFHLLNSLIKDFQLHLQKVQPKLREIFFLSVSDHCKQCCFISQRVLQRFKYF